MALDDTDEATAALEERWVVRYPLGTVDAMRGMGTVAAPLLAGFALATLALLVTSEKQVRFGEVASVAFAMGAVLFVFCLQFTFAALQYSATPSERLAWIADPVSNPSALQHVRRIQRRDHRLQGRYLFRARLTYDLGIVSHLTGLLALVASAGLRSWQAGAFVVITIAMVLELLWIIGGWFGWRPRWLLPGYRDVSSEAEPK